MAASRAIAVGHDIGMVPGATHGGAHASGHGTVLNVPELSALRSPNGDHRILEPAPMGDAALPDSSIILLGLPQPPSPSCSNLQRLSLCDELYK